VMTFVPSRECLSHSSSKTAKSESRNRRYGVAHFA